MSDVAPNDFPQDQGAAAGRQTLGQRLVAERHARGWTVEYVASQLNLATRQIQALEDENYAALPGIASVRGFVRAYAKLLRIEADQLVALIASEQIVPNQPLEPKPNLSSTPFSHSRLSGGASHSNSLKGAMFALVVVLLAAGAIGIEHMGGWPTLSQSLSNQFKDLAGNGAPAGPASAESGEASSASEAMPSSEAKDAAPAASANSGEERDGAKDAAASNPVASAPAQAEPAPAAASAPMPVPAPTPAVSAPVAAPAAKNETSTAATAAKTPAAPAPAAPATSGAAKPGVGTLVLAARQNSWVEVHAGNNTVVAHLLKAGETENITVPGPAQLTIGNAAGVDATFRGQPLPTAGDGKSNVAHINLK